ncbi:MAG: hypothetical protein AAF548_20100 [Actinomycetota bacterium]
MERSLLGKVLMGVGVALVALGVLVLLLGGDDEPAVATAPDTDAPSENASTSSPSTTSTTSTTTSTTSTTTTTTTTEAPPPPVTTDDESPEAFLAVLTAAFAGGDADTLFDRMNSATIVRYGEEQCRSYAAEFAGTPQELAFAGAADVDTWDYVTDDVSSTVTGATAVDVVRTIGDQEIEQTIHWQRVDGRFTWFTDCGDPV